MLVYYRILLAIFLIGFSVNIYANNFGQSCSSLPLDISADEEYLEQDTIYGIVKNSINIKDTEQGCAALKNFTFEICVLDYDDDPKEAQKCNTYYLRQNQTVKFSQLVKSPQLNRLRYLADLPITLRQFAQDLCLTIPSPRGHLPLLCRSLSNGLVVTDKTLIPKIIDDALGCYADNSKSQSALGVSGTVIHCLRKDLGSLFDSYSFSEEAPPLKLFAQFQEELRDIVGILLILYIIFLGVKISLQPSSVKWNDLLSSAIKILLVYYFAIGFGQGANGTTDLALPFLLEIMTKFVEFIFFAAGSATSTAQQGLCIFDPNKYDKGYEFYALWDMFDCRLSAYWGMSTIGAVPAGIAASMFAIAPIFAVIFSLLLAGNIIYFIAILMIGIIMFSHIMFFVSIFAISMITLHSFLYIGPIFIPLSLFPQTKQYFSSWLRLVLSCTVQPLVVGGCMALCLTICDQIFFGNCAFKRITSENKTIFVAELPKENASKCQNSIGYVMQQMQSQKFTEKTFTFFKVTALDIPKNLGNVFEVLFYIWVFSIILESAKNMAASIASGVNSSATFAPNAIENAAKRSAKTAYYAAKAYVQMKKGDKEGAQESGQKAKDAAEDQKADEQSSTDKMSTSNNNDVLSSGKK
jgi:type IV secretion system protein VirB6